MVAFNECRLIDTSHLRVSTHIIDRSFLYMKNKLKTQYLQK